MSDSNKVPGLQHGTPGKMPPLEKNWGGVDLPKPGRVAGPVDVKPPADKR